MVIIGYVSQEQFKLYRSPLFIRFVTCNIPIEHQITDSRCYLTFFSNWSCNHGGCTFLLIIRGCKSTSGTFCAPSEFKSTLLLVSQEFIAVISTSMEQVEVIRNFESRCFLSSRTATWKKSKTFILFFCFPVPVPRFVLYLTPGSVALVHLWIANYVDPLPPSLTIRA